ncbi:hypothetical protein ASPCAL14102 [Aspergillus calidoustus]|uniref:Uncharacterized protein n=1 Tax=Aspergillus calidoustus TaxID=454130 RepID=A0A0U5GGS4_ASPCI|nr:hypothetical protein ASPCAL14102 [Aspergillus calidoustus]
MVLTTESIIALVALLVTGPPSIVLAWSYYKRRARRAALSTTSRTLSDSPQSSSPVPQSLAWSPAPQQPDLLLEPGLYTRRTRTDFHLSQVYFSLEQVR